MDSYSLYLTFVIDLDELGEVINFVKECYPEVVGGVVGSNVSRCVVSFEFIRLVDVLLLICAGELRVILDNFVLELFHFIFKIN